MLIGEVGIQDSIVTGTLAFQGTENSQSSFLAAAPWTPKGACIGEVCAAAQRQSTVSWASLQRDACPGLFPPQPRRRQPEFPWGPGATVTLGTDWPGCFGAAGVCHPAKPGNQAGSGGSGSNPGRWNRAGSAGKHKRKTWLQAGSLDLCQHCTPTAGQEGIRYISVVSSPFPTQGL